MSTSALEKPLAPGPAVASRPQTPGMFFNPRDPAFNKDPYPHYKRLREEDPVHRSPWGVWFLGRYEHVRGVLRDKRFSVQDVPGQLRRRSELLKTRKLIPNQPANLDGLIANSENWFAFLEAPDHTRLRNLVSSAFQKRSVERMREQIRQCAVELLEPVRKQGHMDLMKDFACILPQNVIAHLLGLPKEDFPQCVAWAEVIGRIFDPLVSLEEYARLNEDSISFMAYLKELVAKRRVEPKDDLISALIEARDGQDRLSEAELISIIILIFGAGEETVVSLIGNGSLALIRHPEHLEYLRTHPEVLPSAVEEMLRYDAPLQMTSRTALEDVELGGKIIRKGDQVYVALGSANRDPDQFTEPDSINLLRERNRHMSFADGHHYCVGAPLARIEAQEAYRVLFDTLGDFEVAIDELSYRDHTVLRSMVSLPVRFKERR
ncbi:polyketide biosynthesis cytochrome P450 PksS [Corallococcus coralloides DSM 2259]|uniref:Polyketide biosynthesis cytochrome P450 PksS n=1 Tax=Corallococcus coralloides (strain ATCC 25202 / DSM 2259 / NBRC 100086 / M2) TaxID=1144275 RepID=H8MRD0_CORCM|nr:cytochrome P450 [Corallococcus coralloides]AFE09918.1 polyketide biosynthesis cytochrome P450 PksS [Corallococcus coralloides DSM 2259]